MLFQARERDGSSGALFQAREHGRADRAHLYSRVHARHHSMPHLAYNLRSRGIAPPVLAHHLLGDAEPIRDLLLR
jgi:hypothetical protein